MSETDKFTQLVQDLSDGTITENMMQIAWRKSIKNNPALEGVADILGGQSDTNPGLVYRLMSGIFQVCGSMEMAYLRGKQYSLKELEDAQSQLTDLTTQLQTVTKEGDDAHDNLCQIFNIANRLTTGSGLATTSDIAKIEKLAALGE